MLHMPQQTFRTPPHQAQFSLLETEIAFNACALESRELRVGSAGVRTLTLRGRPGRFPNISEVNLSVDDFIFFDRRKYLNNDAVTV